jgi:hypothetical protein
MPPPPPPPLTQDDYKKINQQLADLGRLQADIDRAREAGIQCDEHDSTCKYYQSQLEQIKKVYFPTQP